METIMLKTADIIPHPNNPRKDLGDLSELTESIKKNGIMQNLTVIPVGDKFKRYMALIGHRRLAAAKAAGLEEVPCIIRTDISEQEQVAIMLEENMQRNDLTPIEQAYGFQLVLDLGGTEDMLAEKTGFSRQTIRHRLQIAKLDKKLLKKRQDDDGWQLNLADLIALEKIKDLKERNHLLMTSNDSRDMIRQIDLYLMKQRRKENAAAYIAKLEEAGAKKAPQELIKNKWSEKYERIKYFNLDSEPEKLRTDISGDVYYIPPDDGFGSVLEIYRKKKRHKPTAEEEERTKKELEAKKRKEHMKGLGQRIAAAQKEFVKGILDKKYGRPESKDIMETLISFGFDQSVGLFRSSMREFFTGKYDYQASEEEKRAANEKIRALSSEEKLLIVNNKNNEHSLERICDWRMQYSATSAEEVQRWHEILGLWGFRLDEEEERKYLDGTHEYFQKGE